MEKATMMSELQAAIWNGQMACAMRIILRAISIIVNEMSPRVSLAAAFDDLPVQVDAPVIVMVHAVACADEKVANVPAEIEHLAALPRRPAQQLIEISELSDAR
jgi:hypothetical protein